MIENAVAVSSLLLFYHPELQLIPFAQVAVIGLFMGPMYPLVMTHTSKVLPKWLVTGTIGWIAGFGQAGSAVIPFVTGIVASKYSISALQPLYAFLSVSSFSTDLNIFHRLIAMMCTMIFLWALVPRSQRRLE